MIRSAVAEEISAAADRPGIISSLKFVRVVRKTDPSTLVTEPS